MWPCMRMSCPVVAVIGKYRELPREYRELIDTPMAVGELLAAFTVGKSSCNCRLAAAFCIKEGH